MSYAIEEPADDAVIAAFLENDRLWSAYALCDLDEPYRRHSRFLCATFQGTIVSLVLIHTPPGFTGLLPFGEVDGIKAILTAPSEWPAETFLLVGEEHLEAIQRRYIVAQPWTMFRMAVNCTTFSTGASNWPVVPLSSADSAAIEALYRVETDHAFFNPAILAHGKYFGAYEAGDLVAVAGTHAWSSRYRVGAVGGVFTHPAFRGRGLAAATTGAVTQALLDAGVEDVVLNVRTDNVPALSAYTRLGFNVVRSYLEGEAKEHVTPLRVEL